MENLITRIKQEWGIYILAVWMIGLTGYLIYLNGVLHSIQRMGMKLNSDIESMTGIVISTDSNVTEIRKQVDDMAAKVTLIQQRARLR